MACDSLSRDAAALHHADIQRHSDAISDEAQHFPRTSVFMKTAYVMCGLERAKQGEDGDSVTSDKELWFNLRQSLLGSLRYVL